MRTEERVPAPATSARTLAEEVGVVLALSLVGSAVYAVIDLFEAPVAGVYTFSFPQVNLARQLAGTILDLAPVWLVLHLVRRRGLDRPKKLRLHSRGGRQLGFLRARSG